jgi:hypothetical protein
MDKLIIVDMQVPKEKKMWFYKCVREPVNEEYTDSTNMFLTYAFNYTITSSDGTYYNSKRLVTLRPKLTLDNIYYTTEGMNDSIIDDHGHITKLEEVMEFLEPYEMKIDEQAERIIEAKRKKGDEIIILPRKDNGNCVSYFISVTCYSKYGKNINVQTYNPSIYEGLTYLYRNLRKRNDNYSMFYHLIHFKVYPYIRLDKKRNG